jgi:hypothetical protein
MAYFSFYGTATLSPFRWIWKILKSGEHFLRIHIPMARVIFEDARCHSFSPPGFFAEIGDETAIASNLSDVIARASINLIAFGEVAYLSPVAPEQAIGGPITYIPPTPVPKTLGSVRAPLFKNGDHRTCYYCAAEQARTRTLLFLLDRAAEFRLELSDPKPFSRLK